MYSIKNLITVSLVLLFSSALLAQAPIEGFRGMKWGTSIDKAKEMMDLNVQQQSGKVKIYGSPNDSHMIGTVNLKEIYYCFHDEAGFFKVILSGNAIENEDMDAILKNRLGRTFERVMDPSHTHQIWTTDNATVIYKQQLSEDFVVSIRSEAIADYKKSQNKMITDF